MEATRSFKKRGTLDCPIAVGYYAKGRYLPPSPHWHPEIEVAYVRQGHIVCTVDDQPLHLAAGDILILSPEQDHLYHSPTEDAQVLFLIFSLDALALDQHHVFQKVFVQPLKEGMLQLPQKPSDRQCLLAMHTRIAVIVTHPDCPCCGAPTGQRRLGAKRTTRRSSFF